MIARNLDCMPQVSKLRVRFLLVGILFFALILVGKLYMVQIVHGASLSEQADRQYVHPDSNVFDRGSIFMTTKDGKRERMATLKSGFTVAIHPSRVSNPEMVYQKISPYISLDKESFFYRAGKKNDPYEEIAHKVDKDDAMAIAALDLDGVRC